MNAMKEHNLESCKLIFAEKGIKYQSFNSGLHWKVGEIDFWPTTLKWLCPGTGEIVIGVKELIKYIRPSTTNISKLSIEQMFNIAKKVKPMSLEKVCEVLHKEIYK